MFDNFPLKLSRMRSPNLVTKSASRCKKSWSRREMNLEGCPLSRLALDFDPAAMILDDPVANRQAQSQPPSLFYREKRLEDLRQIFRIDTKAGVGYRNGYFFGCSRSGRDRLGGHGQGAPFRHRVYRVEIKVNQDLLQFLRIGMNSPQVLLDMGG